MSSAIVVVELTGVEVAVVVVVLLVEMLASLINRLASSITVVILTATISSGTIPMSRGTFIDLWRNSSCAVSPMRLLALPGSRTPGSWISSLSSPKIWIIGSPSPEELTRLSMIVRKLDISSVVGGSSDTA